jgi:hypothetical protein
MQEQRNVGGTAQGLHEAEYELAFFTESARTYWRMWGPLGAPMVESLDSWGEMQRDYFRWAREVSKVVEHASVS